MTEPARITVPDAPMPAYRVLPNGGLSNRPTRLPFGALLRVDRVGSLQSDRTVTVTRLTEAHGRPTDTSYLIYLGDQTAKASYDLVRSLLPETPPVAPETDAQKIERLGAEVEALKAKLAQAEVQIDQVIAQKRAWIKRHNDLVAALRGAIDADANGFTPVVASGVK